MTREESVFVKAGYKNVSDVGPDVVQSFASRLALGDHRVGLARVCVHLYETVDLFMNLFMSFCLCFNMFQLISFK